MDDDLSRFCCQNPDCPDPKKWGRFWQVHSVTQLEWKVYLYSLVATGDRSRRNR